jgi:hypothetical protein
MELSTSREPGICAAAEEIPNILWNSKVHFRVHKSPSLVPILSLKSSAHTPAFLSHINLNIILFFSF